MVTLDAPHVIHSITHTHTHTHTQTHTHTIHHSSEESEIILRWVLVVITIIGFIVLDIAYTAVLVNYCIQCQLLIYLLRSICERIKAKDWEIDQSIKVRGAIFRLCALIQSLVAAQQPCFFFNHTLISDS